MELLNIMMDKDCLHNINYNYDVKNYNMNANSNVKHYMEQYYNAGC